MITNLLLKFQEDFYPADGAAKGLYNYTQFLQNQELMS